MAPLRTLPPTAKRVLISVNPTAGARQRAELIHELCIALEDQGLQVTVVESLAQLRELAADPELRDEIRAVVAGGGDGTVSLVAHETPPGTPIAILPLGTENLLAKYLHSTSDARKLAKVVADGLAVTIDAGQAGERLFLLMVGVGFDAEVVRRMHEQRRGGHISHLSYTKPIFDAVRNYQYPELKVYCRDAEGNTQESTARWVFVVNVPRYAGGLEISPDALATDGLLNVCTFREGSLFNGLVYLSGVMFGQHTQWNDFTTVRASEVRIVADEPVPYQLDGDPGGFLPVDIKILPNRLTMLVSSAWATQRGYMDQPPTIRH
jgi:YegS/Rv2252/BmrU family lipid kinase